MYQLVKKKHQAIWIYGIDISQWNKNKSKMDYLKTLFQQIYDLNNRTDMKFKLIQLQMI